MKPDCACCGHPEKYHCKGGVRHVTYKDQMRMNTKAVGWNCPTRHCEGVLCCCLNYAETNADVRYPDVPLHPDAPSAVTEQLRELFL